MALITLNANDSGSTARVSLNANFAYVESLISANSVVGPASATDNAIARFDATTGKLIQDSGIIVGDLSGNIININTPSVAGVATSIFRIGGASTSGNNNGGTSNITGGAGFGSGAGGDATVLGGTAGATGTGGAGKVYGGDGGASSGNGGNMELFGGNAQAGNGNGGNLSLKGGNKNGSGTNGSIILSASRSSSVGVILNLDAIASTDKTLTVPNASGTIALSDTSTSPMTLLHASNGTSTNTSANNLATVAISGLTSKDSLLIYYTLDATTQNCGTNTIYTNTDGAVIADLLNTNVLGSGKMTAGVVLLRINASLDDRNITAVFDGQNSTGLTNNGAANTAIVRYIFNKTFTTGFTSAWTLALRNGGVTSGGTLYWNWSVYKIAGQ